MTKKNYSQKEHFGLKGVLEQPSVTSSRIPAILFCVYQLMFAAITYVNLLFFGPSNLPSQTYSTVRLSLLVLLQNAVVLVPYSYSSSSGVPSSTIPLLAGLGIPQAGHLLSAVSILQVVLQYTSALVPPHWPSRFISANVAGMVLRD